MKVIVKAAAGEAGLPPELANFAGPLINEGGKAVQELLRQNGGDIAAFL